MRALLLGLTLSLSPLAALAVTLPDPGWDAGRCGALTVSTRTVAGAPGARRVEGFRAVLAMPGQPDDPVGHLFASSLRTDGPASLDALPSLFAGGLLVAGERDRPHGCDLAHAFRRSAEDAASLPAGAQADQEWSGLRAEVGGGTYDAESLHLHAQNGAGGITHITEEATGLSSAGNDMTATPIAHASIAVSIPHDRLVAMARGAPVGPETVVTIDHLILSGDDTRLEAHGTVTPGTRSGHLIVQAQNMEGIKDALPVADRDRVGAMMLVLRLAAKSQADGTLAWDVVWDGSEVTINGVSLPMHL